MRFGILTSDSNTFIRKVCRPLTKTHQKRAARGTAILVKRLSDWRSRGTCLSRPLNVTLRQTIPAPGDPPRQSPQQEKW
jgi:hypothetical protein